MSPGETRIVGGTMPPLKDKAACPVESVTAVSVNSATWFVLRTSGGVGREPVEAFTVGHTNSMQMTVATPTLARCHDVNTEGTDSDIRNLHATTLRTGIGRIV
jgi:hypothetical protein